MPNNRDLVKLAEANGVPGEKGDGNNVVEVWEKVKTAVDRARNGGGPTVFEFSTYRWREHCGPNYDNDIGYRTEEEFQSWKEHDPIAQAEKILMERGEIDEIYKKAMIKSISEEIDEAFDYAQKSPAKRSFLPEAWLWSLALDKRMFRAYFACVVEKYASSKIGGRPPYETH